MKSIPAELRETEALVDLALAEDLGDAGDLTTQHFIAPEQRAKAEIIAKENLVVAGTLALEQVFSRFALCQLELLVEDGDRIFEGQPIAKISGDYQQILTAERTALNFLQRLSGVATLTSRYVERIKHTKARVLDTRKTTPGFRLSEKAAVRAGGGLNHRIGLYDAVMLKDNHVANLDAEQLSERLHSFKCKYPRIPIILEVDTYEQLETFAALPQLDRILLDNMSAEQLSKCVKFIGGQVDLEASGGVTLKTISGIADTGVNYISVGALTHSAPAVDISLQIKI